ncbi:hypothetical protein [Limosilactobacillus panis]|uniref:Uncharacterized protein n=1 Tax=Limosilactobacillus panis TaxID=47493 RepID=A0ABT7VNM6_9LACO|nr:hypothetical protein [Limosilactobacillus panis]MDM8333654.1 hypothetical protein [Limosilactobacillus panis]HJA21190.1 hypothetical protein [Candidatus Limosilactobacillus intestinipullorum]
MATNLSRDDELRGLLSDIARRQFKSSRQINPQSNLFLTAKYAVDKGYISKAQLDTSFSASLAELNLTQATLTPAGERKLKVLINH